MRNFVLLILMFIGSMSFAQDWEDRQIFSGASTTKKLRILSSTDTALFMPIIKSFLALNPTTQIEYFVTGTSNIDTLLRNSPNDFDLVISSAMDLQLKLVNDGLATKVENINLPEWAQWRESLFAFTIEPAAIVINKAAFEGHPIPKTRQELIQALRNRPDFFQGKLGTYDVRTSGLGYLFATQDARTSETFWRLMEVMGALDAKLYCCSGQMIDDLVSGKIAVAYNVLSSYANARIDDKDKIKVILPADFPTTMMRTILMSNATQQRDSATDFIKHLLTVQSNKTSSTDSVLPTLDSSVSQQTISLEPALMTYLDALKSRTFITEWERAIIQ